MTMLGNMVNGYKNENAVELCVENSYDTKAVSNDGVADLLIAVRKELHQLRKDIIAEIQKGNDLLLQTTSETSQLVVESAVTDFIGKKRIFVEDRLTQIENESVSVVRARVLKHVRMLGGLKGSKTGNAWSMAYNVLLNATGFDVYKYGKTPLKAGGKEYGPSYLNTVIQQGYLAHLALVLEELIN